MAYIMLSNLRVILFFVCSIVKQFKNVFMRCLAMGSIIVYCTIKIPNTLNKVAYCMELRVVKSCLI